MNEAGRVALVTGGAGAIGSAVCRALAETGHRVVVADLVEESARNLASELDGLGVELDVTDSASVESAVVRIGDTWAPPAVCVQCAGWDAFLPFLETDEAFAKRVLEINLAGPIRVTRAVLPAMLDEGFGRLVFVASDAGRVGSSLESIYSGAKGGVIAFAKTIARETARQGITANTVCPGPTDTPLIRGMADALPDGERFLGALRRAVPMGRLGLAEDVAPAVAFLASDGAGFVTGQTLSVSGGLTMA